MLAAIRAVNTGGLSLVLVFMGIYLVTERGLSMTAYGLIALAAHTGQSWTQGFAGLLSDRVGRRPVMIAALVIRSGVIAILGALILADAPIWILAVIIVVSSSLRGAFEPVAYALVADVVKPSERVVAFGLQRMGTNAGWAIGPALGGALIAQTSYGAVFFFAAPALLVSALLCLLLAEPERGETVDAGPRTSVVGALRAAFADRDAAVFLFGAFLFAFCHVQLFATLSVYAKATLEMSHAEVGQGYMVNGVLVLLLQLPAVALITHLTNRVALVVGSVLYIASFLAFGHAAALFGIIVAVTILTIGEVILAPAQQAVVAELSDPDKYGRAFGVMGTVQTLGVAISPLVGGIAFDLLGENGVAMWSTLALAPALMLAAFAWFARRMRSKLLS